MSGGVRGGWEDTGAVDLKVPTWVDVRYAVLRRTLDSNFAYRRWPPRCTFDGRETTKSHLATVSFHHEEALVTRLPVEALAAESPSILAPNVQQSRKETSTRVKKE